MSRSAQPLKNRILQGQTMLARCGVFLIVLMPVLGAAHILDGRTVLDVSVWTKPLKFALAISIYVFTLSFYCHYLPEKWRHNRLFISYTMVVILSVVLEMIWLIYAASIAEPSHFNQSHRILKLIYPVMGLVATVLTAQSLVIGIGLLRYKASSLRPMVRLSLSYGLIATCILTLITAGYMSSHPNQSHTVTAPGVPSVSEANALFLVGWHKEIGDLRVAHFFSTHALHFIPIAGWLISMGYKAKLDASIARSHVVAGLLTFGYSVFIAAVFVQALHGKPFIH